MLPDTIKVGTRLRSVCKCENVIGIFRVHRVTAKIAWAWQEDDGKAQHEVIVRARDLREPGAFGEHFELIDEAAEAKGRAGLDKMMLAARPGKLGKPSVCVRCDGTGKICDTCGESEKACGCADDFKLFSNCEDCKGTGK